MLECSVLYLYNTGCRPVHSTMGLGGGGGGGGEAL